MFNLSACSCQCLVYNVINYVHRYHYQYVKLNGRACGPLIYYSGLKDSNACGYNLYDVAVALYRDLASQGLKGYITDEISHLKDLVSL